MPSTATTISAQATKPEALAPTAERDNLPRYLSVAAAARELGVSPATLYRAIAAQEFPAIKIRGSLKVLRELVDDILAAARAGETVDMTTWMAARRARTSAPVGTSA
jgi:excisionase family DNA binding protein